MVAAAPDIGADVASPMANLPVGATFGSLVHAVLEHADPAAADFRAELLGHIDEQRGWWPVELDREELADALEASDLSPDPGECLRAALSDPGADGPRDVILLTHPRVLGEPAVADAAEKRRPDDRLFALAHAELQGVAERQLRRGGAHRTIDPAELVSELYLKLRDQLHGSWAGRAHFYGVAARAMRQILVDLARRQHAAKRGGNDWHPTTLSGKQLPEEVQLEDLLALDAVLEQHDERQRRVVELRFFAGASEQEIADLLGVCEHAADPGITGSRSAGAAPAHPIHS